MARLVCPYIFKRKVVLPFLLVTVFFISGCSSLSYLWQAGRGQLQLSNRARPISLILKEERTPTRIRRLLSEVPKVKSFAETKGLTPTGSYVEYVQLDRPAAVWVVSASEPLVFNSVTWSFPIVGSFPYLGWFNLQQGREFAAELRAKGLDVDLRGARAYSTLGWFRDPVLSSMISENTPEENSLFELVNTVLHESVHASLYINDQAYFNESVASFVADRMTEEYLSYARGRGSVELIAYKKAESDSEERARAFHNAYVELKRLYDSSISNEEKLKQKARVISELKFKVSATREINNATLIQYRTYQTGTREFGELSKRCGGDWRKFLNVLRKHVSASSFSREHSEEIGPVILSLASRGCED